MTRISLNRRRVTLMDVARASGFSPSTVSLVLNEAPLARYIPAKTKQKILDAVERLGYRPDIFARSLRSQRSQMIGVLVIDLADPFCTLILQGGGTQAAAHDLSADRDGRSQSTGAVGTVCRDDDRAKSGGFDHCGELVAVRHHCVGRY